MDEKETKLRQAFSIGCTVDEALCYAEMRKTEWQSFLDLNPDFLHEIEQMQLKPLVKARMAAVKNLDDPKNAQWYLERKKKDEFSLRSETTVKHEFEKLSDQELAERVAREMQEMLKK